MYVEHVVEVFREVRRALRDDGTLWLNMGDCYATGAGAIGQHPGGGAQGERFKEAWGRNRGPRPASDIHRAAMRAQVPDAKTPNANIPVYQPNRFPIAGLKPKDLVGMPWRVAFALQADGWWLRSDVVWCLGHAVRVYAKTQKGEMPMTVGEMARLRPETVRLWSGESWVQVREITPVRAEDGLELEVRNGQRVPCTKEHLWPTDRGLLPAWSLRVGDVIDGTKLPDHLTPDRPESIPDAFGFAAGLYLAEGSRLKADDVQFSIGAHEEEITARLAEFGKAFGSSVSVHDYGKVRQVHLHGGAAPAVLRAYITGDGAKRKHLSSAAWMRSDEFLRQVLLGYLAGDGHYDAPNDRWRLGFTRNDALAADLRTVCARLGWSVRLRRACHGNQAGRYYGWRGELRADVGVRRTADHEIVAIRAAKGGRFYHIEVDAPHTFALASGVVTHNSKPNPMPESVTDRPTRAHEFLFLLAKSATYFYDADAIREPFSTPPDLQKVKVPDYWDVSVGDGAHGSVLRTGREQRRDKTAENRRPGTLRQAPEPGEPDAFHPLGRNKRTVWEIPTEPFPEAHFATFPQALVLPCVQAGSSERGACPKCGAPWERVVEAEGGTIGRDWNEHARGEDDLLIGHTKGRAAKGAPAKKWMEGDPLEIGAKNRGPTGADFYREYRGWEVGWRPGCACNAGVCEACGFVLEWPHVEETASSTKLPAVRQGNQQYLGDEVLREGLRERLDGGASEVDQRPDRKSEGLHPDPGEEPSDGEPGGLRDGASPRHGPLSTEEPAPRRGGPSPERGPVGQPGRESPANAETDARPGDEPRQASPDEMPGLWTRVPGEEERPLRPKCPKCGSSRVSRTVPCEVLDPFSGSGTTLLVAAKNGRDAVGVELKPEYVAIAVGRLRPLEGDLVNPAAVEVDGGKDGGAAEDAGGNAPDQGGARREAEAVPGGAGGVGPPAGEADP